MRQRRAANPELREREAEVMRQRRAADPKLRKREAEAARRRRAAEPELREAHAKHQRTAADPAFRASEAGDSRRRLQQTHHSAKSATASTRESNVSDEGGVSIATTRPTDICSKRADSASEMLVVPATEWPTYCSVCKKSTRNAQTATIPPLKGGVDVAFGTKRSADRELCKTTQASLKPFMVDWSTDTADLEDSQDTNALRGESPVLSLYGSSWLPERDQSCGAATVQDSQPGGVRISESTYSSTCPESDKEAWAETLLPSRRGVDVAVGTSRISDQNLCKSSQASVVPIRIHRWTETSDLDLQDTAEVTGEHQVPFAQGSLRLANEGPGIATSQSGQEDGIRQPASSSGGGSPDSAALSGQARHLGTLRTAVEWAKYWKSESRLEEARRVPFACTNCLTSFGGVDKLASHVESCPWPEPYLCSMCSHPCPDWEALRDHNRTAHVREDNTCEFCLCRHRRRGNAMLHVMQHVRVQQFMCNMCLVAFKAKYLLADHVRRSFVGGISCTQWRRRRRQEGKVWLLPKMPQAQQSESAIEQPFKCDMCCAALADESSLQEHVLHHKDESPPMPETGLSCSQQLQVEDV
ncbi:zinc finger protein 7 isoform X2 [Rhipicephalus sanguineus]|uniref:zinc finger protein 7 isoform X2 n=1 Tax=Rhipicephalus sanguineus TaxID=34632 RepID=UPI001893A278|nr:zinc finger protein 7 isoform X2 [Rhipicephalus sanguineus]